MEPLLTTISSIGSLTQLGITILAETDNSIRAQRDIKKAISEIESLIHDTFKEDAVYLSRTVLAQPSVCKSLVRGEPAERIYKHFLDAYKEGGPALTGRERLRERIGTFVSGVADILLRYNIRPEQALGLKVDAVHDAVDHLERGLDRTTDSAERTHQEVRDIKELLIAEKAGVDLHRRASNQSDLAQKLFDLGKANASRQVASLLLNDEDYLEFPAEIQMRLRILLSGARIHLEGAGEAATDFEEALKDYPENRVLQLNTATTNLLAGNTERALILANRVLADSPHDGTAMGIALQALHVIQGYDAVTRMASESQWIQANATASGALSLIHIKERRFDEAIRLLRIHEPQRIASHSDCQLVSQLADALLGDAQARIVEGSPLPGLFPKEIQTRLEEAQTRYTDVINFLTDTDLRDSYALALANRSVTRILLGQYETTHTDIMESIRLQPDNYPLLTNLARFHFLRGEMNEVIQTIEAVPEEERESALNIMLGEAYLVKGEYHTSIDLLDREVSSTGTVGSLRTEALVALLHAYVRVEDDKNAEATREMLLLEAPTEPHALSSVAASYEFQGRFDEAEAKYRDAICSENERGKDIARLKYSYLLMGQERWAEAASTLGVLASQGTDKEVHRNLALCHLQSGAADKASAVARAYREVHGMCLDLPRIEAHALLALGDTEGAIELYKCIATAQHEDFYSQIAACLELLKLQEVEWVTHHLESWHEYGGIPAPELIFVAKLLFQLGSRRFVDFAIAAHLIGGDDLSINEEYAALLFRAIEAGAVLSLNEVTVNSTATISTSDIQGKDQRTRTINIVSYPRETEKDVAIDSSLARAVLGLGIGDIFEWPDRTDGRLTGRLEGVTHFAYTALAELQARHS